MARLPRQIDIEELIEETKRRPNTQGVSSSVPAHKAPPFERQRAQLPVEMEQAARQVLKDYLAATSTPRVTGNAPRGKRPDADVRDARATIELIRAQFGEEVIRDIEWFVAAVVTRPDGTHMRFADSGAMIAPGKSPEAQRWAGYGALYRTLTLLVRFYQRQRALGKTQTPPTLTDKESLKQLLTTLADRRRRRDEK